MDLELNCANCIDEGKKVTIPPENAKRYPVKIGVKSLKEYIEKGGEIITIPVEHGRKLENEIEK